MGARQHSDYAIFADHRVSLILSSLLFDIRPRKRRGNFSVVTRRSTRTRSTLSDSNLPRAHLNCSQELAGSRNVSSAWKTYSKLPSTRFFAAQAEISGKQCGLFSSKA